MGKRSRGYGAVYRRPDGRWEGQIRIPGGGRRSFYARTRRDVIHRLSQERWALGQGLPVSAGTTSLATFLGRWLAVTGSRLQPNTVRAYAIDVQRIVAFLGRVPLRALTPGMIASTYVSLRQSGLSLPHGRTRALCPSLGPQAGDALGNRQSQPSRARDAAAAPDPRDDGADPGAASGLA